MIESLSSEVQKKDPRERGITSVMSKRNLDI